MNITAVYKTAVDAREEQKDIEIRLARLRRELNCTSNPKKEKALKKQIKYWTEKEAELIEKQINLQEQIEAAGLSTRDRRLLQMRYIDRMSWIQIAMRFGVDEHCPRRWHKKLIERGE